MIELRSVTKPAPSMSALESLDTAPATARATEGSPGTATGEISRSLRHLVVRGGPITQPFETVIELTLWPGASRPPLHVLDPKRGGSSASHNAVRGSPLRGLVTFTPHDQVAGNWSWNPAAESSLCQTWHPVT